MTYNISCGSDDDSWLEVAQEFDREGDLHIAVMELIQDHPNNGFREQCVYISREKVEGLIAHLQYALSNPNYDPYWGVYR